MPCRCWPFTSYTALISCQTQIQTKNVATFTAARPVTAHATEQLQVAAVIPTGFIYDSYNMSSPFLLPRLLLRLLLLYK